MSDIVDCPVLNEPELNEPKDLPYGPTKRSHEFTTENHKLEIDNLPRRVNFHVVKSLIEQHLKLTAHKIRLGHCKAFVAFKTEQERNEALVKINGLEWKGRNLVAKLAAARDDPFLKKTKPDLNNTEQPNDNVDGNDERLENAITADDINSQVCPLWNKTYDEQLRWKERSMRSFLNFGKQLLKLCPGLQRDSPKLYEWAKLDHSCKFDGLISSPCVVGYRNKCEFNIGSDGTVGFRLGRYRDGSEKVASPPDNCPIINQCMFKIIKVFQNFLTGENVTKLRGFNHVTHEGNVRQLTIRTNRKNECLVIIDLHPQDLNQEDLDSEIKKVVDVFKSIEDIVSICFTITEGANRRETSQVTKLVHGQSHLVEYLDIGSEMPLQFRIGPTSFFQVNTLAAEILYKAIAEVADLSSKSLILDVGCGTGTIGLSLAHRVSYVIGIEIVESAIEDAKINAEKNNISNASFFAGKAEDLIGESIRILKNKLSEQNGEGDIVAIVDPPRVGFNNSFIKSLRASSIKKIIYIACDPKSNTNLVSLCRPRSKAYQGDPFVPTRARAFDLFPHTKFCELLLVYERLSCSV